MELLKLPNIYYCHFFQEKVTKKLRGGINASDHLCDEKCYIEYAMMPPHTPYMVH